jgi:hypothetical protein
MDSTDFTLYSLKNIHPMRQCLKEIRKRIIHHIESKDLPVVDFIADIPQSIKVFYFLSMALSQSAGAPTNARVSDWADSSSVSRTFSTAVALVSPEVTSSNMRFFSWTLEERT